jgi:hypothetical protein
MPDKSKDYGAFYLDAELYPFEMELDQGVPDFGIGVQYADFGELAIVYLPLLNVLRGWSARVFVSRLKQTRHPADLIILAFRADVMLLTVGIGWPFAETLFLALCQRLASTMGADEVYRERIEFTRPALPTAGLEGV